jgi:hypothetical protein
MRLRHVTHSGVTAGAQHSQSPVGADMRDGDGSSMLFRLAESAVTIAHVPKEFLFYLRKQTSVSYAADCDVIACYGGDKLTDKHLASKIHCVDDEIIGWLKRRSDLGAAKDGK